MTVFLPKKQRIHKLSRNSNVEQNTLKIQLQYLQLCTSSIKTKYPTLRHKEIASTYHRRATIAIFQVLRAVKIQIIGLHPEDGGSKFLRNVSIPPQYYTASQPGRATMFATRQ
jgi:hypothetical protein